MSTAYKRGILGLAQDLNRRNRKPAQAKSYKPQARSFQATSAKTVSKCFDYMEPIEMSLQNGIYKARAASYFQPAISKSGSRQMSSRQLPLAEIINSGMAYQVEAFEVEPENTQQTENKIETNEVNNFSPAHNYNLEDETNSLPKEPSQEEISSSTANEEQMGAYTASAIESNSNSAEPAPQAEKNVVEAEAAPEENFDDGLDVDDFANDLREILSGQKRYDSHAKKVVSNSADGIPQPPRHGRAQGMENAAKPADNGHAVFDNLKNRFAQAKTFDLGEMSVDKRFKAFDADLDEEEELERHNHINDEEASSDVNELINSGSRQEVRGVSPHFLGRIIQESDLQPGDILLLVTDQHAATAQATVFTGNKRVVPLNGDSRYDLSGLQANAHAIAILRPSVAANLQLDGLEQQNSGGTNKVLAIDKIKIYEAVCQAQANQQCAVYEGLIDFGTTNPITSAHYTEAVQAIFENSIQPIGSHKPNQLYYFGHLVYPGL